MGDGDNNDANNGETCIQNIRCKSGCCRRDSSNCESYCTNKGSENDWCHTQTFLGLYNECPCLPDLTCVFPKNMKVFKITYGLCKKIVVKKKLTKRGFF
ncbi:PREDICTED: colipase-like protein 1 [Myotis davidii]|uniref:colipase-like protein 1 n=1 Tax=Myotis davidii TaxID=225400 RepID=UPI0003EBEC1E|nr:PREDICTED: colipase-like protein 1 [Myotis davidii]